MLPPLPVGLAILVTHDAPGVWRAELRAPLDHGRLVLVRTAAAPEAALAAVLGTTPRRRWSDNAVSIAPSAPRRPTARRTREAAAAVLRENTL
jgi:hypothetical protein